MRENAARESWTLAQCDGVTSRASPSTFPREETLTFDAPRAPRGVSLPCPTRTSDQVTPIIDGGGDGDAAVADSVADTHAGSGKKGRTGKDAYIRVPCGTIVSEVVRVRERHKAPIRAVG